MRILQVAFLLLFNYLDSLPKLYIWVNMFTILTSKVKKESNKDNKMKHHILKDLHMQMFLIIITG